MFPFHAASQTTSWGAAIEAVEEKADEYWNYGAQHGAETNLGTGVNELDIPRHECAILGRMLEKIELIAHLEEMEQPELTEDMSEEEIQDLMYLSLSLNNWAHTAKRLLKLSETEKKQVWNLNCVGRMEIPSSASFELEDGGATFRQDGDTLFVLGDIELDFSTQLRQWLTAHPETKVVILGSGGGNVREAILAGAEIRSRGLDTTLNQNCYSACPLVFLGGRNRTIWSPYPTLGFHQVSINGEPIPLDSEIYELIAGYTAEMGADPRFIIASMFAALPDEMFEPDLDSLCASNVTTWIQRVCGW